MSDKYVQNELAFIHRNEFQARKASHNKNNIIVISSSAAQQQLDGLFNAFLSECTTEKLLRTWFKLFRKYLDDPQFITDIDIHNNNIHAEDANAKKKIDILCFVLDNILHETLYGAISVTRGHAFSIFKRACQASTFLQLFIRQEYESHLNQIVDGNLAKLKLNTKNQNQKLTFIQLRAVVAQLGQLQLVSQSLQNENKEIHNLNSNNSMMELLYEITALLVHDQQSGIAQMKIQQSQLKDLSIQTNSLLSITHQFFVQCYHYRNNMIQQEQDSRNRAIVELFIQAYDKLIDAIGLNGVEQVSQAQTTSTMLQVVFLQKDMPSGCLAQNINIMSLQDSDYINSKQQLKQLASIYSFIALMDLPHCKQSFANDVICDANIFRIISFFAITNAVLKLYAISVLKRLFESICKVSKEKKFAIKAFSEEAHQEIFDSILQYWDFPIKAIASEMMYFVQAYLELIRTDLPILQNQVRQLLKLNESQSKKKYALLSMVQGFVDAEWILSVQGTLVHDLMLKAEQRGTQGPAMFLQKILAQLYVQKNKDFYSWIKLWEEDYIRCIQNESYRVVKGLIERLNPVFQGISTNTFPYLMNKLEKEGRLIDKKFLWCYCSILQYARNMNFAKQEPDGYTICGKFISNSLIHTLLANSDRHLVLGMLEFLTKPQKKAELPTKNEFNLVLHFIKCNLRTSYNDFRQAYLDVFRKYCIRLRAIYDSQLQDAQTQIHAQPQTTTHITINNQTMKSKAAQKVQQTQSFLNFTQFLTQLRDFLLQHLLIPESSFETVYPALEMLSCLFDSFGVAPFQYKKNIGYKSCLLLQNLNFFSYDLYQCLLMTLGTSFEQVRNMVFALLLQFPDSSHLPYINITHVHMLHERALLLCRSPIIRQYECGAFLLSFIAYRCLPVYYQTNAQQSQHKEKSRLQLLQMFVEEILDQTESRFGLFEKSFLKDSQQHTANLPHGLLCAVSLILHHLFSNVKPDKLHLQCELTIEQSWLLKENAFEVTNQQSSIKQIDEMNNSCFAKLLARIMDLMARVMGFALSVTTHDYAKYSFINNTDLAGQTVITDQNKKVSLDCRGHIISEDSQRNEFLQCLSSLLNNNDTTAQITSTNTINDDANLVATGESSENENILVVSFYILTREAGLLLQQLALIRGFDVLHHKHFLRLPQMETLVNQYFETLLSLKHLGSIERITHAISQICLIDFQLAQNSMPLLAKRLQTRLMQELQVHQNIARRSASMPHAMVALLLVDVQYGSQKLLVQQTFNQLFALAAGDTTVNTNANSNTKIIPSNIQERIHALNILKYIFQEGRLSQVVEKHIAEGWMLSMRGFTSQDWGVRNSALMLFSAISWRVFGYVQEGKKKKKGGGGHPGQNFSVLDNDNSKSSQKANIIEFFARFPSLVSFFKETILQFLTEDTQQQQMYPSLYLVAAIFCHIAPLDSQLTAATTAAGKVGEENQQQHQQLFAFSEVKDFLPQLSKCSDHRNYMGRLMVAKALVPFVPADDMPLFITNTLAHQLIHSHASAQTNHNYTHGLLLQLFHVLAIYLEHVKARCLIQNQHQNQIQQQQEEQGHQLVLKMKEQVCCIASMMAKKAFLFLHNKCALIQIMFVKIVNQFFKHFSTKQQNAFSQLNGNPWQEIINHCMMSFEPVLSQIETDVVALSQMADFSYANDFGFSILRKKCIKLFFVAKMAASQSQPSHLNRLYEICHQTLQKYQEFPSKYVKGDNEVTEVILKQMNQSLSVSISIQKNSNIHNLLVHLITVLRDSRSRQPRFSSCIKQVLKCVSTITCKHIESLEEDTINYILFETEKNQNQKTNNQDSIFEVLLALESVFEANSKFVQQLIISFGDVIGLKLKRQKNSSSSKHDIDILKKILRLHLKLVIKYSKPEQVGSLRYAVIGSLKHTCKYLLMSDDDDDNDDGKINSDSNFKMLLQYSRAFINLLQDELPQIRQKMASLLSKEINFTSTFFNQLEQNNQIGQINQIEQINQIKQEEKESQITTHQAYNANYVFPCFISHLVKLFIQKPAIQTNNWVDLFVFLLEMVFEQEEYFEVKRQNHAEKRIFAVDKLNKFHDDFLLKKVSFHHLQQSVIPLLYNHNHINQKDIQEHYRRFLTARKGALIENQYEPFIQNYLNRLFDRDEVNPLFCL